MSLGTVGPQPQRFSIMIRRPFQVTPGMQKYRQISVRFRVIGPKPQSLHVMRLGARLVSLIFLQNRKIVMCFRVIRADT